MPQLPTPRRVVTASAVLATLLAAATPAGAADGAPDRFAGSAEALALDLQVTAPEELLAGLDAALGGATGTNLSALRQKVSMTSAKLDSEGLARATAALLTDGVFDTGVLGAGADDASGSQSYAERDDGVVSLGVGRVEYVADAAGNVTRSASELADLKVTIAPLFAEGSPLPAEVTAPIQEAVGQAADVVDGLVGELNGALDTLEGAVQDTVGQVVDIPAVLPEQLPQVPDVTTVDLVVVRELWSSSSVVTTDGVVRATADSGITAASLLGGLVDVPALTYRSWAQTAGTPGTADAGTELVDIAVGIGDTVVAVTGTRLQVGEFTIDLADPSLEGLPAEDVLSPVQDLLADIVAAAGLSIAPGQGTSSAAPDGSSAQATTSAFAIRLTPLNAVGAADTLDVSLNMLPTAVAVAAAPAAAAPDTPTLPRTGGGAVLLGTAGMAAAFVLRRRVA